MRAFGLLPTAGPRGDGQPAGVAFASAAPSELLQAARQLRTEALKQLLNMFGVGQGEQAGVGGRRCCMRLVVVGLVLLCCTVW